MEQSETQLESSRTLRPLLRPVFCWLLLSFYSIFLLAATIRIAAGRHLWFDEIDTFFVATLPSLRAIWDVLLMGADGQPLGFYIPVHVSYLVFGASEVSARLCAVIPFWATTLVLYYAVSRRTSPLYGFIAALTLPSTVAFQYSFEARPYALVLLFSACSFVAWQAAKERRCRTLSVPMLAIALAAATSVHYNAVLIVIPIMIGELAYSVRSRNIDWGVLIAICASGLPLIFLFPHIRAIHVYSKSYWSAINLGTLYDIYFILLSQFIVLAVIGCAAFGFWAGISRKRLSGIQAEFGTLLPHELAAAGGYLLLPLACFILSFYTRALHYRYVIATMIGVSLFVPFILWIFRSILSIAAVVLCALLALSLLGRTLSRVRSPDEITWGTFATSSELFNPATREIYQSNQPLVVSDGPFLVIAKYGSANLRGRSFYLLNRAHRTNAEIVFRALRSAVQGPLNLAELGDFERTHHSFLMYNPDAWLLDQLLAEGNFVAVLANLPHGVLYEVTVRQ